MWSARIYKSYMNINTVFFVWYIERGSCAEEIFISESSVTLYGFSILT